MTALAQYVRLDSVGRWQPAPGAGWQEVGVSFGKATLVLSDGAGEPLAHWSLPAVRRVNPGSRPAVFAPDAEGSEALEVEDDLLVSAIERVRTTVARARGAPRRNRRLLTLGLGGAALVLAALWVPGAVRRQALDVVPEAKRSEIGATMLGYLQRDLGAACRDPLGAAALERLRSRLLGDESPGQAVVLPSAPPAALALPGGILVVPRSVVVGAAEPAVVAEAILAARAASPDPLAPFLDRLGTLGTLRLLATGEPPAEAVAEHAAALAAAPPTPDAGAVDAALAAAGLATGPEVGAEAPLLLTDGEWVSLQGVCTEAASAG
jgi:hypothetical protein